MLRVLREWVLARSAPASPLAHACALHLLCRDAGMPGCCMMVFGQAGCVLGGGACGYGCARALRVAFDPFRSRKLTCACPCAASALPGLCMMKVVACFALSFAFLFALQAFSATP